MAIPRISHIILTVSDMERSKKFYGEVLGFEFQELPPEFDYLAYFPVEGEGSVWLIKHDATPPDDRFSEFRLGLDHLAFNAPDEAFLQALAEKLKAANVPTNGVEVFHGTWPYVAFRDPDNIQLEYWCNTPVESSKS